MKDNIQICREKVFNIITRELYRSFKKRLNEIHAQFYSSEFKEKKQNEATERFFKELVEINSIMIHNIFRVNDTLTFDFENFHPWNELKGKVKKSHNRKVKTFLEKMGYKGLDKITPSVI